MIDRLKPFLDFLTGGAWPFLVRGVILLVNSDNERDPLLLIKWLNLINNYLITFRLKVVRSESCLTNLPVINGRN